MKTMPQVLRCFLFASVIYDRSIIILLKNHSCVRLRQVLPLFTLYVCIIPPNPPGWGPKALKAIKSDLAILSY